jgi:hypothetical protein
MYDADEAEQILEAVLVKFPEPTPFSVNLTNSGHPKVDVVGALAEWDAVERRLRYLEDNQKQLAEALTADPRDSLRMALFGNAPVLFPRWHWGRDVAARIISMRSDAASASGGNGNTDTDANENTLEILSDILSNQGYNIVYYLWNRPRGADYNSLIDIPNAWRDIPSDEAIEKALKRIAKKLNENPELGVTIEISTSKRRAKLTRLPDK